MPTFRIKRQVEWTIVAEDEAEIDLPYEPTEVEWEGIIIGGMSDENSRGRRSMNSTIRLLNHPKPIKVFWREIEVDDPTEYNAETVVDVTYENMDEEVE